MRMNIGQRLHDAAPGTLAERAELVRSQGFSCVHLALSKTLGKAYMEPAALTPGLAAAVRQDLAGLDVAVLGCYLNLATPDEAEDERSLRRYIAHLRFSRWLDVGVVGTETGDPNREYRYDPERSHTEESLCLFIDRLRPVVRAAERLGAVLAIEPVFKHIVYDGKAARRVLDELASPNLGIILDPVNLLHESNLERRDEVVEEALSLLRENILVLHVKDYVRKADGSLQAAAVGTGEMQWEPILREVWQHHPALQMTLENTTPENALAARETLETMLNGIIS